MLVCFGRDETSYAPSANLNGVLGITVTSPLPGLYRAPTGGGGGARVERGSLGCGGWWGPKSTCLLPVLYVTVCMGGGRTDRGAGVGMGGSRSLYVGRLTGGGGGGCVGRLTGASFGRGGRLAGRSVDDAPGFNDTVRIGASGGTRTIRPGTSLDGIYSCLEPAHSEVDGRGGRGLFPCILKLPALDGIELVVEDILYIGRRPDDADDPPGVEGSLAKSPDEVE